jgi:YHS domain-containing protein
MFKANNAGIAMLTFVLLFTGIVLAASPINTDSNGVAIKGYDPVAYFTMDKPVKGNNDFEHEWKGVKWRFSTKNHMKLFIKDPDKYAPRYGGYCVDVRETWKKDIPGNIKKADMNWPGVLEK